MTTVSTLFSGGGGFDLGVIAAGCTHLWGLEYDPQIADVYRENIGDCHNLDILKADPRKFEKPDWLHASPVCKAFSSANAKAKEKQWDIDCGHKVAEFIEVLQPQYFSLENVMAYRKAKAFHIIVDKLHSLDYWTNWSVLNAADLGVAQSRKRLILRAVKGGFPAPLPAPVKHIGWYEAIADLLPFDKDGLHLKGDVSTWETVDISFLPHNIQRNIAEGFLTAIETIGKSSKREQLIRLAEEPIWTIRALSDEHWWKFRWFVYGLTGLSNIRMAARLQSFPDWYKFPERKSLAGTIIGNSVPPLMAQRIVESTLV